MKQDEISPKVITELIQFLSPNIQRNLRHQALDYLIGLSASDQFNVIFQMVRMHFCYLRSLWGAIRLRFQKPYYRLAELAEANDFLLGQLLCQLICKDNINGGDMLPVLINATANDIICAKYIVGNTEVIQRCIEYYRNNCERYSLNAGKLLSNLSLHFPDTLCNILMKEWQNFIADIIKRLNDSVLCEDTDYLGYVLVNLTSIANVRCLLCKKFVQQILPLVDCSKRPRRCLIAIDILRNICFENNSSKFLGKNMEQN